MTRVGFVGLGTMGGPMAGHLVGAGVPTTVWNRTPAKSEPLAAAGATVARSLSDLAGACDAIAICVGRSEDVREVVRDMVPHSKPGTLFIDHSTIAPAVARELQTELAGRGLRFVDAPITGGSMGAQKGQLTVFLGGVEPDVARAIDVIRPYTKRAERVGGPGAGQVMKLANQIAVAGALLGLCESLSFAKKAGLDVVQAREMIGGGAAGSWAFDNYGPKILAEDWSPGFSIRNQRKDFGYCAGAAEEMNAAIPGTLLVDRMLAILQESGRGEEATAALYEAMMELGFSA